jgi:hypothetical protein
MLRNISVLFSWAVDHHYLTENPCFGIKVEREETDEPVRILSIKEAEYLLKSASTTLSLPLKTGKDRIETITVRPGDLIPWLTVGILTLSNGLSLIVRRMARGESPGTIVGNFRHSLNPSISALGLRIVCAIATDRTTWRNTKILERPPSTWVTVHHKCSMNVIAK